MRYLPVTALLLLSSFGASVSGLHGHHRHEALHHRSKNAPVSKTNPVLLRRDDSSDQEHTCSSHRECDNGACCGKSNVCGFGPVYCGDGCQSNCDAKAECGQYAKVNGTTCPLNVCCSEFGFCGTTAEFCGEGCQSNCGKVDRPASGVTDVRQNVIGYYEMWKADGGGGCGDSGVMLPEMIPVENLDQLNIAFVYIDPKDFTIADMEHVPDLLYTRLADTKTRNPDLKVWISLGGWAFNDPDQYPHLFSDIAASTAKTKMLAKGLLEFMNNYGFDGVDFDWEYPTADDRGGDPKDKSNYPLMLQRIKRFFSVHGGGKDFGISITVPTSYWYLRWFDLKALEEHLDSFNLMSYDLHGTWDGDNPIGSHVYSHTNLTEINLSLDLFWRNDVTPSKINLGLAFYGRTFELESSTCNKPGCDFKGPGPRGECTHTEGILSYTEILMEMDNAGLSVGSGVTYDETAAVYYFNYGDKGNNWLSFDDSVTFQKKIDLANDRGLGGIFVWALDQDDDNMHALKAVLGKNIVSTPLTQDGYGAFDLNKCYVTDCGKKCKSGDTTMTHLNQKNNKGCAEDSDDEHTWAGKSHTQRSFCCPAPTAPDSSTCHWRGEIDNDGICTSSCEPGEVTMALDDSGDGDFQKGFFCDCGGKKAYCCPATNGQKAIQDCKLADKGKDCPSNRPQKLTWVADILEYDSSGSGTEQKLCCPGKPKYSNCGWHGEALTCRNNACPTGQVELTRSAGIHAKDEAEKDKTPFLGCANGDKASFCCDPPVHGGSPFIPVPLENLFPGGKDFSSDLDVDFSEVIQNSPDEVGADEEGEGSDPNKSSFSWMVMVGEPEDVQSFSKRDGSHLQLFDCPNTHVDDFTTQHAKAVCLDDSSDSNCEHILKGGVEGTVVRLPSHCGPDEWVRAVSFERSHSSFVPEHLSKRAGAGAAVYDFHYDYKFDLLRRDGEEIHFRADMSTHPGYWKSLVADPHDSPSKRDASNWRHHDRRWWAEKDPRSWLEKFQNLLKTDKDGKGKVGKEKVGLKKHYEYNECLLGASASCGNANATVKANVFGTLDTTMDMGMSLIGTLKNFGFTEAFTFFNQEDFNATMGVDFEAWAKMHFSSGYVPLGSFDSFGANYFIKGIFKVNPYFELEARVQADVGISTDAQVGISLYHPRYWYFLPDTLADMPVESGSFDTDSKMGPVSTVGEIKASAGGNIAFSVKPSIGVDIGLYIPKKGDLASTNIKLSTTADFDFGVAATARTSCTGIDLTLKAEVEAELSVKSGIEAWGKNEYTFNSPTMRQVYHDCIPFSSLAGRSEHAGFMTLPNSTKLESRALDTPKESKRQCAWSTSHISCPGGDDSSDDPDPDCDMSSLQTKMLYKRSEKEPMDYCKQDTRKDATQYEGFTTDGLQINFPTFPSSGDLAKKFGASNVVSYDGIKPDDCNNFDFGIVTTPKEPGKNKPRYDAEHVLEAQVLPQFFRYMTIKRSNVLSDDSDSNNDGDTEMGEADDDGDVKMGDAESDPNSNPNALEFNDPRQGHTGVINMCDYMKVWWAKNDDDKKAWNAHKFVASAYPGKDGRKWINAEEFVLLPAYINSAVKANYFGGNEETHKTSLNTIIKKAEDKKQPDWGSALKYVKAHIYFYKYLGTPEVQKILVKQVNRVAHNMEKAEDTLLQQNIGGIQGYMDPKAPYRKQDFADEWRAYIKERHAVVEQKSRKFVKEWASTLRSWNSASGTKNAKGIQSNKDIVEMFENMEKVVNSLSPWNINWDLKDSKGNPIM